MGETHGAVWWSELATRDVTAAKDFYASVCGWSYGEAPMDGGLYTLARIGGRNVAGIIDMNLVPEMASMEPHWGTYLAVDDVDEAVERSRAGGGHVIREPWDVPGVGRIALVLDPSGAAVGIMTPAAPSA